MKYENVKYYNEKTRALTLVKKITDKEKKEVETKTYQYPFYVEGVYTQKAIDLGAELEENSYVVSSDLFDRITNFFVELYGKQFTEQELKKGIDQRHIVNTYITMLFGVLQGDSKNE